MKVIKVGDRPTIVWPRQFQCHECRSVLALDVEDIKRDSDFTGDFNSWYVDCPVCFNQPNVPKEWWSTISRMKRDR